MSSRLILVLALLVGVVAGVVAKALGFADIGVQIASGVVFALLIGGPWWWWNRNKSR